MIKINLEEIVSFTIIPEQLSKNYKFRKNYKSSFFSKRASAFYYTQSNKTIRTTK